MDAVGFLLFFCWSFVGPLLSSVGLLWAGVDLVLAFYCVGLLLAFCWSSVGLLLSSVGLLSSSVVFC